MNIPRFSAEVCTVGVYRGAFSSGTRDLGQIVPMQFTTPTAEVTCMRWTCMKECASGGCCDWKCVEHRM